MRTPVEYFLISVIATQLIVGLAVIYQHGDFGFSSEQSLYSEVFMFFVASIHLYFLIRLFKPSNALLIFGFIFFYFG